MWNNRTITEPERRASYLEKPSMPKDNTFVIVDTPFACEYMRSPHIVCMKPKAAT